MSTDKLTCAFIRLAAILLLLAGIADTTTTLRDCLYADITNRTITFATEMKKYIAEAKDDPPSQPPDTEVQQDTEVNRRRVILPPAPNQDEDLNLVNKSHAPKLVLPSARGILFSARSIMLGFVSMGAGICAIFWFFRPSSISHYFTVGLDREISPQIAVRLVLRVWGSLIIAIPAFALLSVMINYLVLGIVQLPPRVFVYAALPIGVGALLITFNYPFSRLILWRLKCDS